LEKYRRIYMDNDERGIYLEKMIANILETKLENIPQPIINHAKDRILDSLGCLICGANDAGNPELLGIVREMGGRPEARILIHGDRVPAGTAAMVNCIMCRSFDFEPVSPVVDGVSVPGHVSGTTTMTALTVGDMQNVTGRELLASTLVGDDMATRVLLAGKGSGTRRGYDHIGQANSFGAVAIAGRLMGLDSSQMRNAFGLILDRLGGAQQMITDTATGFKLSQGTSARDAIFCVRLARAGWTGVKDALLSEGGYYTMFTDGIRDPNALTKDLGKQYYSDGTFKPYPNCRINHATIDSTLNIIRNHDIAGDDIEKVIIYASPGVLKDVLGQPFVIGDFPHACAGFSLQYNVASVLLRGSSLPEHFTEEAIRDPAISDFVKKITMAELTQGNMESGRVKVIMKDGREFDDFTDIARGDPRKPISREELLAKYWTNIEFSRTISRENAEAVIDIVEDLENLDSVRKLVNLLIV
jgi:2-methylcitrate dehydratase PrpD